MKASVFCFLFFVFALPLRAQESPAVRHELHFEIGGTGGIGALAYESSFRKIPLNYSAGFSMFGTNGNTLFIFPLMLKKNFGKGAHHLETGIGDGLVFGFGDGAKIFTKGILLCGWRYQKPEHPLIFRVFYSPLISYIIDVQYQHWGGIGIGYQFGAQ